MSSIISGLFIGLILLWMLTNNEPAETIEIIVKIVFLIAFSYVVYLGFRCFFQNRIQLQFTAIGIKYGDVNFTLEIDYVFFGI